MTKRKPPSELDDESRVVAAWLVGFLHLYEVVELETNVLARPTFERLVSVAAREASRESDERDFGRTELPSIPWWEEGTFDGVEQRLTLSEADKDLLMLGLDLLLSATQTLSSIAHRLQDALESQVALRGPVDPDLITDDDDAPF